jgi:uncharacterized membrane protein (UPF0127 family)
MRPCDGYWQIRVVRTNEPLATRAAMARSPVSRMVGLLGRRSLEDGEGLVLTACRSIHTAFMRFPIDAVFLDGRQAVVRVWKALPPWRMTPIVLRAQAVVELPAGTVARTQLVVGDQLVVEPVDGQKGLTSRGTDRYT